MQDRRTALHAGSELGNTEDVKLLLEHGASPGIKTADGFSPLDFATRAGNRVIVQLLAEHGAIRGEEFQKHPPSSYSSLAEFSMIRDEMRYTRGVEVDIKTPKLKVSWLQLAKDSIIKASMSSLPLVMRIMFSSAGVSSTCDVRCTNASWSK